MVVRRQANPVKAAIHLGDALAQALFGLVMASQTYSARSRPYYDASSPLKL